MHVNLYDSFHHYLPRPKLPELAGEGKEEQAKHSLLLSTVIIVCFFILGCKSVNSLKILSWPFPQVLSKQLNFHVTTDVLVRK